jgi:hypothetical protein
MVIGPHHTADTYVGEAPKWASGQREHMVRQGITAGNWSEFLCLGGSLARCTKRGGGVPRGMRSADTPPSIPAAVSLPPAGPAMTGAGLGIEPLDAKRFGTTLRFPVTRNFMFLLAQRRRWGARQGPVGAAAPW